MLLFNDFASQQAARLSVMAEILDKMHLHGVPGCGLVAHDADVL